MKKVITAADAEATKAEPPATATPGKPTTTMHNLPEHVEAFDDW